MTSENLDGLWVLIAANITKYDTKIWDFIQTNINPIQDGLFGGCSRMVGAKRPPSLKSVSHILQ